MHSPALFYLRRARTWALRWVVSFLMLTGYLPPPLLLLWLEWLLSDMGPTHPGVQVVLAEIATVKDRCHA